MVTIATMWTKLLRIMYKPEDLYQLEVLDLSEDVRSVLPIQSFTSAEL